MTISMVFRKNLSQSRLLNNDYSHPSPHVCLIFPLKISPMPPGQAESGVEARSACKHHSTMAGRTCVVVYLYCCLLVLLSTCVVVYLCCCLLVLSSTCIVIYLCCCLSFVFFEFSSVCGYLWDKRDRKRRAAGVGHFQDGAGRGNS